MGLSTSTSNGERAREQDHAMSGHINSSHIIEQVGDRHLTPHAVAAALSRNVRPRSAEPMADHLHPSRSIARPAKAPLPAPMIVPVVLRSL